MSNYRHQYFTPFVTDRQTGGDVELVKSSVIM